MSVLKNIRLCIYRSMRRVNIFIRLIVSLIKIPPVFTIEPDCYVAEAFIPRVYCFIFDGVI